MNEDYIVTAMTSDGLFRVLAARSTLTVEEGRRRHKTSRTATAALGRVMTGAALMAATLDDDQSVTLRILADGPSGGIIAEAANAGKEVRGYMSPMPTSRRLSRKLIRAGYWDGRARSRTGFRAWRP